MTAELVDGDAWERLTELAVGFNQTEMAEQFRLRSAMRKNIRSSFAICYGRKQKAKP